MTTNRRAMIAGLAGIGLAAGGGVRAATAAAAPQDIFSGPAAEFGSGFIEDGGFSPTGVDLSGGGFGRVDVVVSAIAPPPGLAAFNMMRFELPAAIQDGTDKGYRLRGLCVQAHAETVIALFQLGGPPGPESWHIGQTPAEYQALVGQAARTGLEPVFISVDNMDGAPRFTTLLRRSTTAWEARHGLKLADLTPLTKAMQARGFRLARSVPYLAAGALRFANLYRPAGQHGWQAWVGDEDPSVRDQQFRAQGYALLQAVSYEEGGKRRWSCVWQKAEGAPQDYFWGN